MPPGDYGNSIVPPSVVEHLKEGCRAGLGEVKPRYSTRLPRRPIIPQARTTARRDSMSDTAPPPPEAVLTQMIFGKWVAMALSVAAKLRLADALASGPKSVADLAEKAGTHPP